MMIEYATVIDYQEGFATVQCQAKRGCGSCTSQSICGTQTLSALAGEKSSPLFKVKVNAPLRIGDKIELGIEERHLLFSLFLLYGLPLVSLISTSLLLSHWIDNELLVALAIFFCTMTTFYAVKKWLSTPNTTQFEPIFIRKL